jgi:hypothetical protein
VAVADIETTTARWVQPAGLRLAAWVVGACGLGLTLWSVIQGGWDGFGILLFTGVLTAASGAALRQRVTVGDREIVICNGLWTWRIRRTDDVRLTWRTWQEAGWPRALAHVRGAGKLYVVPSSGRAVAVPATEVTDIERPRRSASAMAAWLSAAAALPIQPGVVPEADEWDWD